MNQLYAMGTWGTAIKSNDTACDVYADYMYRYNEGAAPAAITEQIIHDNQDLINDSEEAHNFWLTLALANWETKALEESLFRRVASIIESGADLDLWRVLDATESTVSKRKAALDKFLIQISSPKPKAKRRKKRTLKAPIFEKGACLCFRLANGNYGGAIVLEADHTQGYGCNLIVTTRINQRVEPTKRDFERADVLVYNFGQHSTDRIYTWYYPNLYIKSYALLFKQVCTVEVKQSYNSSDTTLDPSYTANWQFIISHLEEQLKHEATHPRPPRMHVSDLLKKYSRWKLWQ